MLGFLRKKRPYPKGEAWLHCLATIYLQEPEKYFLNWILNVLDEEIGNLDINLNNKKYISQSTEFNTLGRTLEKVLICC